MTGCYEYSNEPSGSMKCRITCTNKQIFAFQNICSTELIA
jgi:hypothetical protein